MNTTFAVNTPTVAHESIDGEVIVINLVSGNYYSLEGTGAEIWGLIDRGYSLPNITSILANQYTTDTLDISPTIDLFVAQLVREDLIITKEQDTTEQPLPQSIKLDSIVFSIPTINRYSDMQELLLLDPIHDVDAAGWPKITV